MPDGSGTAHPLTFQPPALSGPIKGRGSASLLAHRFARQAREAFDDGWGDASYAGECGDAAADTIRAPASPVAPATPATTVRFEQARSAISRNDSPDLGFEQTVNPYRGCEHGCIYCYARPTHSYLDLSPGLDFETQLVARTNIAQVLRREIAKPSYHCKEIVIGSVTDAYQPIEREYRLTRALIELMHETSHPFSLVTKSSAVERDLDLIAPMAQRGLCSIHITVTTLDASLARTLEPRAAAPWRRLKTIETLAKAGVPVCVSVAPQIPFLNDDMEQVLEAAWQAGARRAFYSVLRLPWELSPLFREWLQQHHPQRADRVMARIHDLRGGKNYDSDFAQRMKGQGPWADLLAQRFRKTCARLGFNRERITLRTDLFEPPAVASPDGQHRLF